MFATILARLAGVDTENGATWYEKGMAWAVEQNISDGTAPEGGITREQAVTMLYRYAGSPAASSSALNGFADQSAVSSYAVTAMQWAVGNGIITGVSTNGRTTLSAKNNATRAQVSVMLHRFLTMEQ